MKVALVADGNSALGMGHVYQTITLSRYLRDALGGSPDLQILTTSAPSVAQLLASSGCPVHQCDDDAAIADRLREMRPDRVVIDKLDVSPALAKTISQTFRTKLIILTNLSDANRYADVTVMAGMGSDFKNIRRHVGNQVQLWGPRYWLIRPEFLGVPAKALGQVKVVTLIFGGADPANLSTAMLAELLGLEGGYFINLILGAAFPHQAALDAAMTEHADARSRVALMTNTDRVAQIMHESDLVLVSPGLSFFEALLVGTPVLCFHQNAFQRDAWQGHIKTYDKVDIAQLGTLLRQKRFIFPNDPRVVAMEIGQGIGEIVSEIVS